MIKEIGVAAGCASSKHQAQARKLFILQRFIRKSVHVKVRGRGKNDREKSFCGCRKFTDSKYLNRIRCATYTSSTVSLNSLLMQYWCY